MSNNFLTDFLKKIFAASFEVCKGLSLKCMPILWGSLLMPLCIVDILLFHFTVFESVSMHNRAHVSNTMELFWVVGSSSLSLGAYFLRSWWQLQLLISAPALLIGAVSIW